MARAAEGFGLAGLASLLLHGGAVVAMLAGLPAPPALAPPPVVEMTFLATPEATAEALPETMSEVPPEATAAMAEATPPEPTLPDATPPDTVPPDAVPVGAAPSPPEMAADAPPDEPPPTPAPIPQPRQHRPRVPNPRPAQSGAAAVSAPSPQAALVRAEPAPSPAPARTAPQSYIAALFMALDRRKEYPESARWRRAEGTAILRVALRRDGSVQAWRIERGSGHEDLDQAIGSMVRRASPLPAPPADLPGDPVEFSIPVRFSLR